MRKSVSNQTIFLVGLIIFVLSNVFSAVYTPLHFDEAYYWMYSQKPAWGYFDHPPLTGWLIFLGTHISDSEFGVRLPTLILSIFSIFNIWFLINDDSKNATLFWAVIFSVILIHPYFFIATPDAPLFFFATSFFVVYKRFINHDSLLTVFLLAVVSAGMLYSKYHGILILFFVFISNLKLITRKKFWIYILFMLILMVPHIIWQLNHNFISFRYHLIDSHQSGFDPLVVLEYVFSQILLSGPWFGWLFLYALLVHKSSNFTETAMKFSSVGVFVLFFAASFSGDYEAHWPLVAYIPLLVFAYKHIKANPRFIKAVYIGSLVNFVLLLLVRVVFLLPVSSQIKALKSFVGWETDSKLLQSYVGDYPVVFQDSWNKAARYAWYTRNSNVANLNSGMYRSNQFDVWKNYKKFEGQTVCVVTTDSSQFDEAIKVESLKNTWYVKPIENFCAFYESRFNIIQKNIFADSVLYDLEYISAKNIADKSLCEAPEIVFAHCLCKNGKWSTYDMSEAMILDDKQRITLSLQVPEEWEGRMYLMMKTGNLKPVPFRYEIKKEAMQCKAP